MRIAFIGQKGIPATFGGIETHVEELAGRLTGRGHEVSVYVRGWYTPKNLKTHKGARLIHTPTINTKHLDAFVHSLTSSVHSLFKDYDIIHYHGLGPTFFSFIPLLARKKVVATVHGLDWQRGKWGKGASSFLRFTEKTAVHIPQRTIVVSRTMKEYFEGKYGKKVVYIPNGVNISRPRRSSIIKDKWGLRGDDYIFFMGRLSPEKRVELLIRSFKKIKTGGLKLVIAGASSATQGYAEGLKAEAKGAGDIIFTGNVTGQEKEELLTNAKLFVLPSSVEGLPITLLEAMSYGTPCLASGISPHKEVITEGLNGYLFRTDDLQDLETRLEDLIGAGPPALKKTGHNGKRAVMEGYNWDSITTRLEEVYNSVLEVKNGRSG